MKSRSARRRVWLYLLLFLSAAVGLLLAFGPVLVDREANATYDGGLPRDVTAAEHALHRSLFIADLHADTLLWNRGILTQSGRGHLDLPRLIQANVALQVFSVVTTVPFRTRRTGADGKEESCNAADGFDTTALLRIVQAKAPGRWFDAEAAALAQARELHGLSETSRDLRELNKNAPELMQIFDVHDLERLIARRRAGDAVVGAVLAIEGAHWIKGSEADIAAAVTRLYVAGFRMVGPIHRFDNALGRSSEGCGGGPALTESGAAFLREADRQGIIIDLAHADDATLLAALPGRQWPVAVSHTGIRRLCEAKQGCRLSRNLSDEAVQAIARNGGLIGIGYWTGAVGRGSSRIADAFEAALDVLEAPDFVAEMRSGGRHYEPLEHLALGSDFDGASLTPFDVTGLDGLTATLARRAARLDEKALRLIAGVNACRMLALRLPKGGEQAAQRICDPLRGNWRDAKTPAETTR
jgi:microsomal dipeptidase-like Zn-dependent dipeptidase